MAYGLLDQNNVLVQKQLVAQDGFISIPDSAVCGQVKVGNDFVTPAPSNETLAARERVWRDAELAASDFTQLTDAPLLPQAVADWADYRQALRNMPTLSGFPTSHTRPEAP
jgi:hypothetical protein